MLRDTLVEAIWRGRDPLADPTQTVMTDVQGWSSNHPFLARAVRELRPTFAVEVGVWKGASCITLAKAMRDNDVSGVILAVDTFLGSSEHWLQDKYFAKMPFRDGLPVLFHTFVSNVRASGLERFVLPLPLDSANAAVVVAAQELAVDLLHIDAGHDQPSVTADLTRWWPLLRPGGVLILDDYDPDGGKWPGVREAVRDFFGPAPIESANQKGWILKVAP